MSDHLNIQQDFGAIPNDKSATAKTANSAAFKLAQAAMKVDPTKSPNMLIRSFGGRLFVPAGDFYFGEDLHIVKAVVLFGNGMYGTSTLWFDQGASLVVIQA